MSEANDITARKAGPDDARHIAEIQVRAWQLAYRGMIPDSVLDALNVADRANRWDGIIARETSTTLVAEQKGRIVGWIGFGASRDDDARDSAGEIYGLYVHPDRWRTRIGSLMWNEACSQLAS